MFDPTPTGALAACRRPFRARPRLLLAPLRAVVKHGLDVVAVGVAEVRPVVAGVVLGALARLSQRDEARRGAEAVERGDRRAIGGGECEMNSARRLALQDRHARDIAVARHERTFGNLRRRPGRDPRDLEVDDGGDGLVEARRLVEVCDADPEMVEDAGAPRGTSWTASTLLPAGSVTKAP